MIRNLQWGEYFADIAEDTGRRNIFKRDATDKRMAANKKMQISVEEETKKKRTTTKKKKDKILQHTHFWESALLINT